MKSYQNNTSAKSKQICKNRQLTESHLISLLPPVFKLLETLILPDIKHGIELAEQQYGFRKRRSTTTALHVYNIPQPIKRWIANYLVGRQIYVEFRDLRSPKNESMGTTRRCDLTNTSICIWANFQYR